jgi:hypothetical protein
MKHITTLAIAIFAIALALPATAPAHTATYAVRVTVQLKFHAPQRISGKVSSPLPACRSSRRVEIRASGGSTVAEFVTDDSGVFHGPPATGLAAHEDYRVRVFRSVASNRNGHRHVCAGLVVALGERSPGHAR